MKEFQKETNPVRSKKNVRGVFVSGTSFIFSKYESSASQANDKKGEIPAYGTLGRFLLHQLPGEFASPEDYGSPAVFFPQEGLIGSHKIRLAYSAVSVDGDAKKLTVRRLQRNSVGALEEELQDKDFWLNIETDSNFDKPKAKNTGFIFVENRGSFYPVTANMPDTALDSREALIAIGGLLSSNVSSVDGPKNIFDSCLDQTDYDGAWNIIYEDGASGEIRREVCPFCDDLYKKTQEESLERNQFVKQKDESYQAKFFENEFAQAFANEIKTMAQSPDGQKFKHGASLLNQRQEFVISADGLGENEVYFALGKYG